MRRGQKEFLIYHPNSAAQGNEARVDKNRTARLQLDLILSPGPFAVEWYRPHDGVAQGVGSIDGKAVRELTAPWQGYDIVLRLLKIEDAKSKER